MDVRTEFARLIEASGAEIIRKTGTGHGMYRFPNGKIWPYSGLAQLKNWLRQNGYAHLLQRQKSDASKEKKHQHKKRATGVGFDLYATKRQPTSPFTVRPPQPVGNDALRKQIAAQVIAPTPRYREIRSSFTPRAYNTQHHGAAAAVARVPLPEIEAVDFRKYDEDRERERKEKEAKRAIERHWQLPSDPVEKDDGVGTLVDAAKLVKKTRTPREKVEIAPTLSLTPEEKELANNLLATCGREEMDKYVREIMESKRSGRVIAFKPSTATKITGAAMQQNHQQNKSGSAVTVARTFDESVQQTKATIAGLHAQIADHQKQIGQKQAEIKMLEDGLTALEMMAKEFRNAAGAFQKHGISLPMVPSAMQPSATSGASDAPQGRRKIAGRGERAKQILAFADAMNGPFTFSELWAGGANFPDATRGAVYQTTLKMSMDGELVRVTNVEQKQGEDGKPARFLLDHPARAKAQYPERIIELKSDESHGDDDQEGLREGDDAQQEVSGHAIA